MRGLQMRRAQINAVASRPPRSAARFIFACGWRCLTCLCDGAGWGELVNAGACAKAWESPANSGNVSALPDSVNDNPQDPGNRAWRIF